MSDTITTISDGDSYAGGDSVITIQTVYELASEIGEHFKKLIEKYGQDSSQDLIPSVVRALEHLEEAVIQHENYQLMLDKLQNQIKDLQRGQQERLQRQNRYMLDIEDIDESWRKENSKLSQYVNFLRSENTRLVNSLNEKFSHSLSDLKHDDEGEEEEEDRFKSLDTSTNTEKLKIRISLLCKEIELNKDDIDILRTRNEKLEQENQKLHNLVASMRDVSHTKCETIKNSLTRNDDYLRKAESETSNAMKEKILLLEKELDIYKRKLKLAQTNQLVQPGSIESNRNDRNNNAEKAFDALENQDWTSLPVQGPLPRDYFPKGPKTRIWSFFPRLTRAFIK